MSYPSLSDDAVREWASTAALVQHKMTIHASVVRSLCDALLRARAALAAVVTEEEWEQVGWRCTSVRDCLHPMDRPPTSANPWPGAAMSHRDLCRACGEGAASVEDECPTCGAYVLNHELHRDWHNHLRSAGVVLVVAATVAARAHGPAIYDLGRRADSYKSPPTYRGGV